MKRVLVTIMLLACFQSYGWAQQRTAGVAEGDARRVMEEMKRKDIGGMFRQKQPRLAVPMESKSTYQQITSQSENAHEARPIITVTKPKPQEQAAKAPGFSVVAVATPPLQKPLLQDRMVSYSPSEQPYVQPEPSLYLENGCIARTFYHHIEHHPLMIEVKLKPNDGLAYESGDGEKIQFGRIEDVPKDGILYFWKGRQVFLRFGSICGLDGDKEVALCYKSHQLEVTVKRAKIVVLGANVKK